MWNFENFCVSIRLVLIPDIYIYTHIHEHKGEGDGMEMAQCLSDNNTYFFVSIFLKKYVLLSEYIRPRMEKSHSKRHELSFCDLVSIVIVLTVPQKSHDFHDWQHLFSRICVYTWVYILRWLKCCTIRTCDLTPFVLMKSTNSTTKDLTPFVLVKHIFLHGYCSTVQGLLDWFEVDLGFTELLFLWNIFCYTSAVRCKQKWLLLRGSPDFCILDFCWEGKRDSCWEGKRDSCWREKGTLVGGKKGLLLRGKDGLLLRGKEGLLLAGKRDSCWHKSASVPLNKSQSEIRTRARMQRFLHSWADPKKYVWGGFG